MTPLEIVRKDGEPMNIVDWAFLLCSAICIVGSLYLLARAFVKALEQEDSDHGER